MKALVGLAALLLACACATASRHRTPHPNPVPVCERSAVSLAEARKASLQSLAGSAAEGFRLESLGIGTASNEAPDKLGGAWSCARDRLGWGCQRKAEGEALTPRVGLSTLDSRLESVNLWVPCGVGAKEPVCAQYQAYKDELTRRYGPPTLHVARLCEVPGEMGPAKRSCVSWTADGSRLSMGAVRSTEFSDRLEMFLRIESVPGLPPACTVEEEQE